MHCNGKCQMMKKIQAEEKKDKEGSERKTDNKIDIQFFVSIHSAMGATVAFNQPNNIRHSYQNKTTVDRNGDIFHPPQA